MPALEDGEALPLIPGLVTGRAVIERRVIHIEDSRKLPKSEYPDSVKLQKRLKHRTTLAVPLLKEGSAIGAIVVRRNEVHPFTDKQISLLSTFADQAAIAIENVRLFNETTRLLKETEQRAAELQIINSIQQGLASKLEFQSIIDLVGDQVRVTTNARSVFIALYDKVSGLVSSHLIEPANFRTTYSLGETNGLLGFEVGDEALASKATEWYARGIKTNPFDGYNYLRMGMCLDFLGRHDEAEAFFSRADELDPNGYYTAANIGWHYVQAGKYAAARPWLERSLRLEWKENTIATSYLAIANERLRRAAENQGWQLTPRPSASPAQPAPDWPEPPETGAPEGENN